MLSIWGTLRFGGELETPLGMWSEVLVEIEQPLENLH